MDNKEFSAQVMSVIKNNLAEIRKSLLNLDDYVAKKDYDELKQKYDTAQFSVEKFQQQKLQLETGLETKFAMVKESAQKISTMFDALNNLGNELRQVERQNLTLETSLEKLQQENSQFKSELSAKTEKIPTLSKEFSRLFDVLANLGEEVRKLEKQKQSLENSIETLQQENSRLKIELLEKSAKVSKSAQEISKLYSERDNLENDLRQVEKENLTLETSLEKILPIIEEQTAILESYIKNYSELERIYAEYKKLPSHTKFALEGIFGAENSPTSFLAGVLHEGHLESLFDYVAKAINTDAPSAELEILRTLFEFAFDAVNSGRREKIFVRLKISEGDNFDSAEMKKTSNSEQSGKVKKIWLIGYEYFRTKKIIRQSLVTIG